MNASPVNQRSAPGALPQGRLANGAHALDNAAKVALWLLLVVACPGQAGTLAQALEQAWLRHPQAAAHTARQAEAQARGDLAAGLTPAPAALALSSLGDRYNANRGQREWEAEVAVPLWLPGQRSARQALARSAAAELEARSLEQRLQIAGELRAAWWQLAAARQAVALAAGRAETARMLEADVRRRFLAGELPRVDANLAQGEFLAAQADELESRTAQLAVEQVWRNLTGTAAPAQLDEVEPPATLTVSDAHPQLAAAAATAQAARDRLRMAEATRGDAPELALRVVRERGGHSERYANQMGVTLKIPLGSAPRLRQETSAAQADLALAETVLSRARQRLQLDADRTRDELAAAERQLAMAHQRRALAADTLQLAEKSFALGEADLHTLLRARAAAQESDGAYGRIQLARSAAQSRLHQALGVLP
jgi:cobalt-zinc-cadmium efflux system outer membrane protein